VVFLVSLNIRFAGKFYGLLQLGFEPFNSFTECSSRCAQFPQSAIGGILIIGLRELHSRMPNLLGHELNVPLQKSPPLVAL
jgi:hypothetical protein